MHPVHGLLGCVAGAHELNVPLGRLVDGPVDEFEAENLLAQSSRVVLWEEGGAGSGARDLDGVEVLERDGEIDERGLPSVVGVEDGQFVGRGVDCEV